MLVFVEHGLVSSFVKLMVFLEFLVERGTRCTIFEQVSLAMHEWNNLVRLGTNKGPDGGGFWSSTFDPVEMPLPNFLHA